LLVNAAKYLNYFAYPRGFYITDNSNRNYLCDQLIKDGADVKARVIYLDRRMSLALARQNLVPGIVNVCTAYNADIIVTSDGSRLLFKDGPPKTRYRKQRVIVNLHSDITIGDVVSLFNLTETQVIDSVMKSAYSLKNFLYCNEKVGLYKNIWDLDDFLGMKCSEIPLFFLDYVEKTPFVFFLTAENACNLYSQLSIRASDLNKKLSENCAYATGYYKNLLLVSEEEKVSVSSSLSHLYSVVDDVQVQTHIKMMEFRDLKISRFDYDEFDNQKESISELDNRHVLALVKENYTYLDKLGLSSGEMSRMRNLIYEYTCDDVDALKLFSEVSVIGHIGVAQHFIRIYLSDYQPEVRKGYSTVVSVRFKILLYNRQCDFLGVLSDHYTSMLPLLKDCRGYYFEYDSSIIQSSEIRVEDIKYAFNYICFDMPGSCSRYHIEHLYFDDVRFWDVELRRYSPHGSNMTIAPIDDLVFRKPNRDILADFSSLTNFITYHARNNNYGKVQVMIQDSLVYTYVSIGDLIYDKKYLTYDKNCCVYLRLGEIT